MNSLMEFWKAIVPTPLFGITLTVLVFLMSRKIQGFAKGAAMANPVLLSILIIGGVLKLTSTPYQTYFRGAEFIHFLLGPATVALAVPMVHNFVHLKRSFLGVALALIAGSLTSAISGIAIVQACGGSWTVACSMAPKAATTPIAMAVAMSTEGIPSLTAVLAISSGILVAVFISPILSTLKIHDWRAFGLAAGTAGSGIGAARALPLHSMAGAFAGLAVGLNGLLTAIFIPLIIHLWHGKFMVHGS